MAPPARLDVAMHTLTPEHKHKKFEEEHIMVSVEKDGDEYGNAAAPGLKSDNNVFDDNDDDDDEDDGKEHDRTLPKPNSVPSVSDSRFLPPVWTRAQASTPISNGDAASADCAPPSLFYSLPRSNLSSKRTALDLEVSYASDEEQDNLPVTSHFRRRIRRKRSSKCRPIILSDDESSTPCHSLVEKESHTVEYYEEYRGGEKKNMTDNMGEQASKVENAIEESDAESDDDDIPLILTHRLSRTTKSFASNIDSGFYSDDDGELNTSSDASSILSDLTDTPPTTSFSSPASSPSPLSLSHVASVVDPYRNFKYAQRFLEEESTSFFDNAQDCPFFSETGFQDTNMPLMTLAQRSVIITAQNQVVSSAGCLDRCPHELDIAANEGDHLLVRPRPRTATASKYASRKPTELDIPRGKVSLDVCPFAQILDRAGEQQLLQVGKRVSSRAAATQAIRDARTIKDKQDYCHSQLTLEQNASKTYLSYHAVTLTYEDVRVLRNGWLTDNNITFWEEYLEREVLPKYPQARIALLRASLTLILMATDSIDAARKALPDFRATTHIFLPISNAKDLSRSESGSHWSLLLVSIIDGVSFHYDSMGTSNLREAREVTARMAVLLGTPLRFRHIDDTPQQDNGNDCGVFVCVLMRFLLVKRLLNAHAREKVSMSLGGKMIDAQGGRKEMLRIIENLRREGERRRSTSPFVKKDVPRIE
ncbi:MAG: hypothetical protein SEPTF4163_003507 [Sporothrix epigloea]